MKNLISSIIIILTATFSSICSLFANDMSLDEILLEYLLSYAAETKYNELVEIRAYKYDGAENLLQIEDVIENEESEEAVETKFKGKDGEKLNRLLKRLADIEKELKVLKSGVQEKGEELDKEKYKMLIAEYRKFKAKNVKHFRFNSALNSSSFGKS